MAGIGFALARLAQHDTLSLRTFAATQAIVLTSGPWVIMMAGIAVVSAFASPISVSSFTIALVYAFALSQVVSAPLALSVTVRISELLYRGRFTEVHRIHTTGLAFAAMASQIAGIVLFVFVLDLDWSLAVPMLLCTSAAALLWQSMTLIVAIRRHHVSSAAFAVGLSVGTSVALIAERAGWGAAGMLHGYTVGLLTTFFILNHMIALTFPAAPGLEPTRTRTRDLRLRNYVLAGLAGSSGLWIDKIVVWASPEAIALHNGLHYAPAYDFPFFLAILSLLPALSLFTMWLETEFFVQFRRYRDLIVGGGTMRSIEDQRRRLVESTAVAIGHHFVLQLAVALFLYASVPLVVANGVLGPEAARTLRVMLLAAPFQLLFLVNCAIILFVQEHRRYLALQMGFLLLNGGLTYVLIHGPLARPEWLGAGYATAAVVSGCIAHLAATDLLRQLNCYVFIVNNPALAAGH